MWDAWKKRSLSCRLEVGRGQETTDLGVEAGGGSVDYQEAAYKKLFSENPEKRSLKTDKDSLPTQTLVMKLPDGSSSLTSPAHIQRKTP